MNNLRELFENEYPGKKVIYEQIIKLIFDKAKNTTLTNNQILTNSEKSQINSLSIIAQVRGGFPITFADVELKDSVILNRSRVSIQNCVRRILENDSNAIIFFHFADNKKEWRVSYVYRGDTAKDSTNAKRYTYICGKEHACRTIAERFDTLQGLEHITEKELLTAFSVEALSSEFFDKYREIYADFVEYISGKRYIKQSGKFVEKKTKNANPQFKTQFNNDEKSVRDYVKKMLGRIVFLYFLQKKGWLGDSVENGKWGFGDKNFMGNLFNNSCNKDDFLEKVLEPLFFQTLNSFRENNIAPSAVCKEYGSKIKIPYLNGGLFEKDELDIKQIKFKKEMFEKLFTLFSQYNFTIDETDSDDIEVGVDPEMLGKIFENLLEDNKDKGAFYTPKEIVQYMCRESLIAYLLTDSKIQEEKIRTLVTEHTDPAFTENEKSEIKTKLDNVKICDPAVGSGAFPMGMMNELIACHSVICKEDFDRAAIKKQIVQNNIYGVDIEKGAVDIARLRFWLAIIVDEKEPIPLPNLDYKIMQGNSLLESIEGIDLSHLTESAKGELFDDAETLNNLKDALQGFYVPDSSIAKDKIRNQIKEYVITLMKERQLAPAAISKLSAKDYKLHENSDFFLWHTWFNDVFNRSFDKGNSAPGGFDIVIGNPPYGAKTSEQNKKEYQKYFEAAKTITGIQKGSTDTFAIFVNQGFNLLKTNGFLSFIVPMAVNSSDAMTALHNLLEKNCDTMRISSYSNRPKQIFDAACIRTSVFMFRKTLTPTKYVFTSKLVRRRNTDTIGDLIRNLHFFNSYDIKLSGRYAKVGTQEEYKIIKKMFSTGKKLSDYENEKGKVFYYRTSGGRYFNVVTVKTTGSNKERNIKVNFNMIIASLLSTNLFWFYQQVYTNGLDLKQSEINSFPVPVIENISSAKLKEIENKYNEYLKDIDKNAITHTTSAYTTGTFKEYKIRKSKKIIDEIDDLICPLYGLTKEETEFIKNYEIEFRMSDEE